jgi:Flp pilus assembly protein TadG
MTTPAHRNTKPSPSRRHDERGISSLELVVVVPVMLAMLGLAVIGGRVAKADGEIHGAARAAARAASTQRSPADAQAAADAAAQAELTSAGVTCTHYNISVATGGPGGFDRVQLACTVPLGDVDWIGVGPSKTVTATFTSPVDEYRQYSGS